MRCLCKYNTYTKNSHTHTHTHPHSYDLGRVCYLAQDFKPLMQMPELQLELAGAGDEDAEIQREAERELEALGRKTDTWLAIFQVCSVSVCVLVSVSLTVCLGLCR